ncbi:hypothetical protein BAUCODRAFT_54266, partial [Baudoinia panamericana UAMH 10762]
PPPDSRELLPPLVACLPTAFMAPRPPPALMPILAPTLRQRVNFMSDSAEGWLPLLSWDEERAARLPDVVERMQLEAHPVSGELDLGDVRPAKYRRLDDETLHSRLDVDQYELSPLFVWCENDEHGETGAGWKLTELRSLEDAEDGAPWFDSVLEANDAASTHTIPVPQNNGHTSSHAAFSIPADEEDEDDGSYWAAYDRTPGRTPAQKHSPAPPASTSLQSGNRQRSQSELEYFARYGGVQPAMDGHDPDEETPDTAAPAPALAPAPVSLRPDNPPPQRTYVPLGLETNNLAPDKAHDSVLASANAQYMRDGPAGDLSMPRPISPTSSQGSVERLEEQAEVIVVTDRAQLGIKQHISTDIKSLFRLAKSAGMERSDFDEFIRRELDVLCLLEADE